MTEGVYVVPACANCGHPRILDVFVSGGVPTGGHMRLGPCMTCHKEGKWCPTFVEKREGWSHERPQYG